MPLHINLQHEIEQAHAQSKRDPLKISIFILAGVVAIFAAMYFLQMGKFAVADKEYKKLKAEHAGLEPKAKSAAASEAELQTKIGKGGLLVRRIEDRFYWAPILGEFAALVPREVQITRVDGRVQGTNLKKIEIVIDGISAGAEPRKVAEDLRQTLGDSFANRYKEITSEFRKLDDGTHQVTLDGKEWPTANFTIGIKFEVGEIPATPVPRKKR